MITDTACINSIGIIVLFLICSANGHGQEFEREGNKRLNYS